MALQHLRSSTADKRPTPAAMSDGQLALNTNLASPGLFFKDSNGDSVKIGPVHVGTTAPNVTPGAGGQAGNSKGEQWLDTTATNPILKVWNGSAFVAVQPVGTGTVVSTTDTGTVTSTMILDGTILNADINASAAIVDTKLATIATAGKVSNSATTATNANTASAIVARDASGNFSAGTITAALTGAASSNVLKAGDTMTGALVVPLASAATPSLTFTGDLNTGIYSPGADQLAVATNGAQRVFVASGGNVGIGPSTSLGVQMDVNTTSTNSCVIRARNDTTVVYLDANNGYSYLNTFTDHPFLIGTNNQERLRITSAGLVGIGSSAPQAELNVAKTGGAATVYIESDASNNATTSILRFGGASGRSASIQGFRGASSNIHSLDFYTYNSADAFGMRLTSTGLGIGSSTPSELLELSATTDPKIHFVDVGNTTAKIGIVGSTALGFEMAGSERARIDASGRLLVGTSTSVGTLVGLGSTLQVNEGSGVAASLLRSTNDVSGANLVFRKTRDTTPTGVTVVQNGDILGRLVWMGTDGTNPLEAARITAEVDGTPGANDMPGRLVFSTTADGASSPTERMRITNDGRIYSLPTYNNTAAASANMHVDSNGIFYRATSSAKYKTDIETLEDQYADALLNVRPVWYRSTTGNEPTDWSWYGFIAEEVAEIDPRLVHWKTVEGVPNENGQIEYTELETPVAEGVQYDRFVPHLLNLIKRQQQAIETLEAKVAALESA